MILAGGRDPNPLFSPSNYLQANLDVAASGLAPLHYEAYDWREGRNPSATFSTPGNFPANSDVQAAHIDPLQHFLQHAHAEGRHGWEVRGERGRRSTSSVGLPTKS